jgi:hypothetical protein
MFNKCPWTVGVITMLVSISLLPRFAAATENANEHYPLGALTVAPAVLPLPGDTEFRNYTIYVEADKFVNNNGASSPALSQFHLSIYADIARLIHTWNTTLGPFNISSGITINPIDSYLSVGGEHYHRFAMGDTSFQPLWLTYNTPSLHILFGPNIWAPTGAYNKNNPVSPGLNYWTFAPEMAVTWFPQPAWEVSADMFTQFNSTNRATEYHSGNDSNIDFSLGWRPLAVTSRLQLGISGYLYRQWADDTSHGVVVPNDRGRVLGIGPQIGWYFIPHGRMVLKWEHEFDVRNRPAGNRLWIGLAMPVK